MSCFRALNSEIVMGFKFYLEDFNHIRIFCVFQDCVCLMHGFYDVLICDKLNANGYSKAKRVSMQFQFSNESGTNKHFY